MDDILHIGLWFIFIVLAFLVQLHIFSGEKIIKVAKLVIVFFSIALTAPIIDLILTGGVGAKMNYLSLHSWKDIVWSYITVGGSSLSRGATPGIRIEITLLVLASFNYVRTKKNSILKGIIAAVSIYTVLFLSGAIPLFLGYIVNTFHLQYQQDDQSTVLLLLTFDIFLFCFALFLHSSSHIYKILSSAPWIQVIICILLLGFGASLALENYPGNWILTPTTLFWFPLLLACCVFFAAYAGVLKLQAAATEKNQYNIVKNGLIFLLLIITGMLSAKIFFSATLLWGLLFLLSEVPLELKKIPVLCNVIEAMILTAAAFAGFCIFNAPMIGFPPVWILMIFSAGFAGGVAIKILHNRKNAA
ncbi:MAG: hypothetical protein JNM14_04410 [Ferruginibacter sp.]|nr:hypothetical protein [Ferruginibacter sp.]